MHTSNTNISCPSCNHKFDVNNELSKQLEESVRAKYEAKSAADRQALEQQQSTLAAQENNLKRQETAVAEKIEAGVQAKLTAMREEIVNTERSKAQKDTQTSVNMLEKELEEKSKQVQELNETRSENSRLLREAASMKARLEAEHEQKFTTRLHTERERIAAEESSKAAMQVKEQQITISQLNEKLKDAQQKAEQGSTQLQGDAQELAVEEWLHSQYPIDSIERVKTGALGADCIQKINSPTKQSCGTIYYESKRTKAFQMKWIEKFKADIRDRNADIGVIVSQARPAGHDRMTQIDGIWICNFEEFKGLCIALRNQIIEVDRVAISQENRGDKMHMLWDYLQSNEFRLQVDGIVEGFTTLKTELEKEKRATNAQWNRREKQIDKVLLNTANMYGAIKGIAGSSIQPVAALEYVVE